MACFLAVAAEAVVVSAVKKHVEKKEKIAQFQDTVIPPMQEKRISWSRKLTWLNNLLWGGVFLLCIEHIWHGEVVPWPPFLTAMYDPADIPIMLQEIVTVGGSMALFVTAVWFVATLIADRISACASTQAPSAQAE